MWFKSDNAGPAAPEVMSALQRANEGYASPYGDDEIMERVRNRIREIFEAPEAAVYLVATGTAANSLGLACLCPPWGTIFCHRNAHVEEDECGAPEFYTGGAKLTLVEGKDALMDPASLQEALEASERAGVHNVQKGALSLTQATENGAAYTVSQIEKLTGLAKSAGIPCHMDGARFTNALLRKNCSPAEMTWRAGIDILSFGGTKNGLLGVEAVILFDPAKAWEFELRRKRAGHLFSKHRYLSAQMDAYLQDDLWLKLGRMSNAAADRLAHGIKDNPSARLDHPVGGNQIFASWPRSGHRSAHEAGAKYYFWPFNQSLDGPEEELLSARLVCNWSTTDQEVDQLLSCIR